MSIAVPRTAYPMDKLDNCPHLLILRSSLCNS